MPAVDCAKRLLKCLSKWRHTASHGHVAGKPSQYPYCCLYVLVHIVAIKRHDQISLLCYASFTHQRRLDRGFHGDKCPSELLGRVHWPHAIRVDMSLTHGLAPQSPLILIAPSVACQHIVDLHHTYIHTHLMRWPWGRHMTWLDRVAWDHIITPWTNAFGIPKQLYVPFLVAWGSVRSQATEHLSF